MKVSGLMPLLGLAPPAQPGQQQAPFWTSLVPLGLLVVVFYFVLIRPQQKKAKDQNEDERSPIKKWSMKFVVHAHREKQKAK